MDGCVYVHMHVFPERNTVIKVDPKDVRWSRVAVLASKVQTLVHEDTILLPLSQSHHSEAHLLSKCLISQDHSVAHLLSKCLISQDHSVADLISKCLISQDHSVADLLSKCLISQDP